MRSLLAKGMWFHKYYVEPEEDEEIEIEDDGTEEDADPIVTVEEIAGKYERLLRRAAAQICRAKHFTRLLNADITLRLESGSRQLQIRHQPWSGWKIDDYDRMSILNSELKKYDHDVRFVDPDL